MNIIINLEAGMRTLTILSVLIVCLVIPDVSTGASREKTGQRAGNGKERVLAVGKVTMEPRKHFPRFKGLAEFLENHLSDLGVSEVTVLFVKDNREMIENINAGKIDFISETMFSSMLYMQETDMEILVREWRNNVPEYHTVFFARKDSNIQGLSDLKGKIVAFEDSGSTSAYMLPRSVLNREGLQLVEMGWPGLEPEAAPEGTVGYVFARTETNIPIWVHEGRVQAGVLSNTDWVDEELVPPHFKQDLMVFYRTEPVPRSLFLGRKSLPGDILERVREVLLEVYEEEQKSGLATKFSEVTKYDAVPAAEVARFKELFEQLGNNRQ